MASIRFIDQDTLLKWLGDLGIKHYLCGQCQGVHISEIQGLENVAESRLFLEQDCLIYTTELEVRNSYLLAINAELPRLNGTFVNLKLFLDIIDDGPARLIICDSQWVAAGVSKDQLGVYIRTAIETKLEAINLLTDAGFLGGGGVIPEEVTTEAIH